MSNGSCKHFTGIQNAVCKAGVAYDTVRIVEATDGRLAPQGLPNRLWPCLAGARLDNCDQREYPTAEEIEAENAHTVSFVADVNAVLIAIRTKVGRRRGVAGHIACPVCEHGTVRYDVSATNGHVAAACSTDGCVRFMQ